MLVEHLRNTSAPQNTQVVLECLTKSNPKKLINSKKNANKKIKLYFSGRRIIIHFKLIHNFIFSKSTKLRNFFRYFLSGSVMVFDAILLSKYVHEKMHLIKNNSIFFKALSLVHLFRAFFIQSVLIYWFAWLWFFFCLIMQHCYCKSHTHTKWKYHKFNSCHAKNKSVH